MKKTLLILLLCVITLAAFFCSCDKINKKEETVDDIIKKVDIRKETNQLTVVYEDGYERTYSVTQPIVIVTEEDGTRSARAIGSVRTLNITVSGDSFEFGTGDGLTWGTAEYINVNGNMQFENAEGTNNLVFSTGNGEADGIFYIYQSSAVSQTSYFEHDGKKYEDCTAQVLEKCRTITTLLDFAAGYEKEPINSIGAKGFTDFGNLEAIILPASVKAVNQKAFDGCQKLATVYFCGTPEEWEAIELVETEVKDEDGKETHETTPNLLASCTVYFYSEAEPTANGSYWHYVDGKPTQW